MGRATLEGRLSDKPLILDAISTNSMLLLARLQHQPAMIRGKSSTLWQFNTRFLAFSDRQRKIFEML